ncbi:putative spermidine/putrescine transport system permease protein [Vibrio gazogenes DSM 21264]|uniref:Putative spermidine/putrescine transport system permease protein n=1 Tax=Vibrio gazogenes DSM 21264 = NBRC 103151 TaxID=1123492 RepID=A0A1M5ELK9_VIBGA|nr:putative spermidine/putrescine transport system permease protein [Vibrio gazogenes DSM 21264] [Vibrio gazogenes DSM 21264 = NBRC 103151]SJN54056.1 Trehalose transport system permease protein SugB [Vibrio gazogenes]
MKPKETPMLPFTPRSRIRLKKWQPLLWLIPFAVVFYLFQISPMLWVVTNSFSDGTQLSFDNYREIFDSPFILQGFSNSLWLALWSSLIGLFIAALLVSSLRHLNNGVRDAVIAFTNMSSNFVGVPLAFAFIIILGTNGALTLILRQLGILDDFNLYGRWGLLAIYTYFQIPLGALLLYPAFDALKKDWQEAAALLGADTRQYWFKIALPILAPALFGTFIILFANAIGAYASAYALTLGNYNLITIRIASLVSGDLFLEPNLAAAISVLLIVILAFVTIINQWLIVQSDHTQSDRRRRRSTKSRSLIRKDHAKHASDLS